MAVHPSGLHVLAGPAGPATDPKELAANYGTLVALLERFYDVVLLDLGTGFANPVARFALLRADHAIMVSGSDFISSTRVAKVSARLLDPSGPARLRPDHFTVIVNRLTDPARLERAAASYRELGARTVIALPEDRAARGDARHGHLQPRPARARDAGGDPRAGADDRPALRLAKVSRSR